MTSGGSPSGRTTLDTPRGPMTVHLEVPDAAPGTGPGTAPGVVVLHEIGGLTDDIADWCRKFAGAGYVALAPDLFSIGGRLGCLWDIVRSASAGQGPTFELIEIARQRVASHPACNGKVGVVGFCLGGGFALLLAPRGQFAAASSAYGRLPKDPQTYLAGSCPVVGHYGTGVGGMPKDAARLDAALTACGVPHDVKVYEGATHSFMNHHEGPVSFVGKLIGYRYAADATEDAWNRLRTTFDAALR